VQFFTSRIVSLLPRGFIDTYDRGLCWFGLDWVKKADTWWTVLTGPTSGESGWVELRMVDPCDGSLSEMLDRNQRQ